MCTSIVLEAIPFMFVGALAGGLIEVLVSPDRMVSVLPRRDWLTVSIAAGAGIVFPVCDCAVVTLTHKTAIKSIATPADPYLYQRGELRWRRRGESTA